MVDEELHERIEKYLLGELSAEDNTRLEAEMASDPALFEQVEIQRIGLIGLRQLSASDLKEKFVQWDEELNSKPDQSISSPTPHTKINPWFYISIALLLLLITATILYVQQLKKIQKIEGQKNTEVAGRDSIIVNLQTELQKKQVALSELEEQLKLSYDSIMQLKGSHPQKQKNLKDKTNRAMNIRLQEGKPQIAMQFAPPINTQDVRGGFDDGDSILNKAVKYFEAKNYKEAINLLSSIPKADPRQAQIAQILPYALFYGKEFQAAIPAFINLMKIDRFESMRAQWYLLLCYVAEGQNDDIRQVLNDILKNPQHQFFGDAQKLIENLEK